MTFTRVSFLCLLLAISFIRSFSQYELKMTDDEKIDTMGFWDSSHHWYSIFDDDRVITPLPDQKRYRDSEIAQIADNVLLFQKANGGWPKNYDMLAILDDQQRRAVLQTRNDLNTTFDNGTTHSQVEYLAKAYSTTKDSRYREACLRGIDFILSAQYANGGWPQFYPDTSGYQKYITFNDGAMTGVMEVLQRILENRPYYSFVDDDRKERIRKAYAMGIDCILECQIIQNGVRTVWGQQHDNVDFRPRAARTFEPASLSGGESAEVVLLLMGIDSPSTGVIEAVQSAVRWFDRSKIEGIRVKVIPALMVRYKYHITSSDRIIEKDPAAPSIWARLYELGTNRPLFCNRDMKVVYSLAEVDRERRTGYSWYTYAPSEVLEKYPEWQKRWAPADNVLSH